MCFSNSGLTGGYSGGSQAYPGYQTQDYAGALGQPKPYSAPANAFGGAYRPFEGSPESRAGSSGYGVMAPPGGSPLASRAAAGAAGPLARTGQVGIGSGANGYSLTGGTSGRVRIKEGGDGEGGGDAGGGDAGGGVGGGEAGGGVDIPPPATSAPGSSNGDGTPAPAAPVPRNDPYAGTPYAGMFLDYGQGNVRIPAAGPWQSIPFMQSYAGNPAPYADLNAQIWDALGFAQQGAGFWGNNAAARYNFGGGQQPNNPPYNRPGQMRPNPGLGGNFGAPPSQMRPPPQYGVPPGYGGQQPPPANSAPPPGQPQGAVDHTANFQKLLQQDPSGRLAQEYRLRSGDTINWWQQNKDKLFGSTDQLNQWINSTSPQSSNVGPLSESEMALLNQMAGIRR